MRQQLPLNKNDKRMKLRQLQTPRQLQKPRLLKMPLLPKQRLQRKRDSLMRLPQRRQDLQKKKD